MSSSHTSHPLQAPLMSAHVSLLGELQVPPTYIHEQALLAISKLKGVLEDLDQEWSNDSEDM
jgi:hypothetical protein